MVESGRRGLIIDVLLLCLVLAGYGLLVLHSDFLVDDAFISFRYADNLANGHGLRFNIGEDPPVEGFSNFLWVLALAFFVKLGFSPLVVSKVLASLCGALLIVLVYARSKSLFGLDRFRAFLAALSLASLPPLAAWSTGGLETVPYTLFLFLLFTELLSTGKPSWPRRAGAMGIIIMLLRPDGIAHALLVGAVAALYFHYLGSGTEWRKGMARYGRILVGGFLVLTLFRLIYFEALLPNTYYAKVGFTVDQLVRGAQYVAHFMLSYPGAPLVAVVSLFLLLRGRRKGGMMPAALLYLALLGFPVLLGGDFMAMARFMVPALPFLSILLAGRVFPPPGKVRTATGALLAAATIAILVLDLLPAFDVHATPASLRARVNSRWGKRYMSDREYWRKMKLNAEKFALIGKTIGGAAGPEESIVTGAIGAIGYYSGMRVYDIYGLVDRDVARSKMAREARPAGHDKSVDAFYFYHKYEPTYIEPRFVPLEDVELWRRKLWRRVIDRSKSSSVAYLREYFFQFKRDYELVTIPVYFDYEGTKLVLLAFKKKSGRS